MQKFSFSDPIVYFEIGRELTVRSKCSFPEQVTLMISSSYPDLDNKIFQIKPDNTFIFSYRPTTTGFITAQRIWGNIWDDAGTLDVEFKHYVETPVETVAQPAKHGTSKPLDKTRTFYDFNGWSKIKVHKKVAPVFEFMLNERDGAFYTVVCDDKSFVIENPYVYFTSNHNQFVTVTKNDLAQIGVCLSVSLGGTKYDLQGAQGIDDLYDELQMVFYSDTKLRVYKQSDAVLIYSEHNDRNKLKFSGLNTSFDKIFQKSYDDKIALKVKCVDFDWHKKSVSFDIVANGLVKRPKMIVHFENTIGREYLFEDVTLIDGETCDVKLISTKPISNLVLQTSNNVMCQNNASTQVDANVVKWTVTPRSTGKASVGVKNLIEREFHIGERLKAMDLLYSLHVTKDDATVKLFLNRSVDYDYDYDIELRDGLSKRGVDYHMVTQRHAINAGQTEHKEKIAWTTKQPLRSFDVLLAGKTIPIVYVDRNYFPTVISLRDSLNVKHYVNRSVSTPLVLQYNDGSTTGTITLAPGTTDWQFVSKSGSTDWKVFCNDILLFQQTVYYVKAIDAKPKLRLDFDNNVSSKTKNVLKVRLDWPIDKETNFEIDATSSYDFKISGKYRFKPNQTYMEFKLTPVKLKNRPIVLSLRIASSDVEFDPGRYSVIIN